jgi:hypothetical protein
MSSGMVTDSQPAPGPNGAPSPSGQGRSPVASRMDARAALRASLEKGEDAAAANTASDGEVAVGATPDSRSGSPDGSGSTPTPSAEEGEAEKSAKPPAEKHDAETEKRLAKVQDAEKRSREKLAAERKQFDEERAAAAKERAEMAKAREEYDAFLKLKEKAKLDPAAALEALGVEDFDYAARQAYARTKAKAEDPGNREAAARAMREREAADKLTATEKRIIELEKRLEERDQRAQVQKQAEEYMSGVLKNAQANPLAKHFLDKDPDHVNQRLRRIAYDLAQEMDDVPDAEDVIARYEQEERKTLARYGVNPDTILAPQAPTKKNEQAAEKKNAAPTLSNDLTTHRVARTRETEREKRDAVRAALESGKLD